MRKVVYEEIITLEEDVRIPGANIILEKGDQIKIVENKMKQYKVIINYVDDVLGIDLKGMIFSGYEEKGKVYLYIDDGGEPLQLNINDVKEINYRKEETETLNEAGISKNATPEKIANFIAKEYKGNKRKSTGSNPYSDVKSAEVDVAFSKRSKIIKDFMRQGWVDITDDGLYQDGVIALSNSEVTAIFPANPIGSNRLIINIEGSKKAKSTDGSYYD